MNTDVNHEPAITFMQTGNQITGKPCLGAGAHGLGSMNENSPTYVVLIMKSTNTEQLQAIGTRVVNGGYLLANMPRFPPHGRDLTRSSTILPAWMNKSGAKRSMA